MSQKIFIRADGSRLIGMGHIVRCTALAHMLSTEFEITFVCRELPLESGVEIEQSGFKLMRIENESSFFYLLDTNNIVVLDGYDFDKNFQTRIRNKNCLLICIDDLHEGEFVADLIVNHASGVKPQDYMAQPYTQFAIGMEYALLRPGFLKAAAQTRKIAKIETVLICFGGADFKNLTQRTLRNTMQFSELKEIIVVTGPSYNELISLKTLINSDKRVRHFHAVKGDQMLDLLLKAELSIVPASGILYEAIASGGRVVTGMFVDNQKIFYKEFIENKIKGDAKQFEDNEIRDAIRAVLSQKDDNWRRERSSIIGSGTRLLKIFKQLHQRRFLELRNATAEDISITFAWASNPGIRKYSLSKNKIVIEEHIGWLQQKLKDRSCMFLIAEYLGKAVGSIRFDKERDTLNISYLLDTAFHGKGLGTMLLSGGIEKVMMSEMFSGIRQITGAVMKENIPSVKAFERLGFTAHEHKNYLIFQKGAK